MKKGSFSLPMSTSSFAGGAAADVPPGARVHEGAPPPPNLLGNAEWVREEDVTNCEPSLQPGLALSVRICQRR
jgi:hypothetical protein